MNKQVMLKMGIIVSAVLVTVMIFNVLTKTDAKDSFNAQMNAIKNQDSSVDFNKDYYEYSRKLFEESNLSLNEYQSEAALNALNSFTYEIISVEDQGDDNYIITFEIDSYPISSSMLDYKNNPEDYLTSEEVDIFLGESFSSQAYRDVSNKLYTNYYNNLKELKPDRVKMSVEYVYSKDENIYVLKNEEDFDKIVMVIIGLGAPK